ncbi:hypothetical protein Patl1_02636 [Pistacia atlantica]|uniref:Uncharacterized protein n=1 Tax=Pistacia atlantica TaxID=434234 RepID=A0ACC1CDX6_9ROSI|nr:hypothetical protein Patl1_02636 [Pistacia atlantica]
MDSMSNDFTWRVSFPNPCQPSSSWPGIECKPGKDGFLHVSKLHFGSKPNPSCKYTATFPSQIFSLPYLQSLFFFNCFTHTQTTLSFSQNSNSSLQQLSLRSNPSLVGPIPPQLSSFKTLQILTLSQNRLIGSIPVKIFSLDSLLHLDLSYNLVTGTIPVQVGNLKNLVGLDLSYNSLSGSIPITIGQLGMLQKLDLSSNLVSGSIPDSIEQLGSLVFLALSNNKLRGRFPKGLAKLQSLQYFIMDNNPMFIPLPIEFGKLVKLQELRLVSSGYSGSIPPSFSQLKNLSSLSLENNRLTGEIPATFLNRLGRNLELTGNPGLCLSPTEAYSVKIGIGISVCGSNKNGSLVHPFKKSEAAPSGCGQLSNSILIISIVALLVLSFFTFHN